MKLIGKVLQAIAPIMFAYSLLLFGLGIFSKFILAIKFDKWILGSVVFIISILLWLLGKYLIKRAEQSQALSGPALPMTKSKEILLVTFTLGGAAAIFLIITVFSWKIYQEDLEFLKNGREVLGQVTYKWTESRRNYSDYYIKIRYLKPAVDTSSKQVSDGQFSTNYKVYTKYQVGDAISLLYLDQNPEYLKVKEDLIWENKSPINRFDFPLYITIFWLVLLGMALFTILRKRNKAA